MASFYREDPQAFPSGNGVSLKQQGWDDAQINALAPMSEDYDRMMQVSLDNDPNASFLGSAYGFGAYSNGPTGQPLPVPSLAPESVSGQASSSGSRSEEEDLEQKRKAQNRAAQRAFRERKEKKVQELQKQLEDIRGQLTQATQHYELLERENTMLNTKLQILSSARDVQPSERATNRQLTFPMELFQSQLLEGAPPAHTWEYASLGDEQGNFQYQEPKQGEVMLGAGAIWQMIADEDEDLDVEKVIGLLKNKERCDGFGPVYSRSDVAHAIAQAKAMA